MKKFFAMSLIVLATVFGAAQLLSPSAQAGNKSLRGCNCTKGLICCLDCNGNPAFCARSHAFCPECPAP